MALKISTHLHPHALVPQLKRLFDLSAAKLASLVKTWQPEEGTPVFTVRGLYTSRGWTEWTQGFQFGSALLQYDATGDESALAWGREQTRLHMASHVSHIGVHDHGFNNISTYGNLLRMAYEDKCDATPGDLDFWAMSLKVSGAVQAARWSRTEDGSGYIYSFNGPHSLFIDTLRSLRVLGVAHQLGHALMGEQDRRISLLGRLLEHAWNSARYNVYYGKGRDAYDVRGRTAHESIFNMNDGCYRCPSSQQGYSPFSTWTRGLAWAILGFAEQLEFLRDLDPADFKAALETLPRSKAAKASNRIPDSPAAFLDRMLQAAAATADFYIDHSCADGIPMWDTGAPNLYRLGDYEAKPANPFNDWEPVDSSAAAIAAQGLYRLGNYLMGEDKIDSAVRYRQAGLTVASTLFAEPYLSTDTRHQGLLLHSVYHRPNGWDFVAPGQKVPNGESSMWGDYHARELGLLLLREARGDGYLTFYGGLTAK